MSRRPYEFDNFVIADGSAAVLDLAVNRRSFPAAEKTPSAETAEVLENVRARLDLLLDGKKNDNLRLIRMILRELSPALLEQNALAVVSRFVADNFPRLGEKKALDFYFHPRTLAVVRPFLAETAAADSFAGRILLHEDETLAPADCRICWQQGETAFCGGEKIRRLEAMLTGEKND